jgi:hypothetical protein
MKSTKNKKYCCNTASFLIIWHLKQQNTQITFKHKFMNHLKIAILASFVCCLLLVACSKTEDSNTVTPTPTGTDYSTIMKTAFSSYGASNVTVSTDGNYLVVKSTGIPDHKSPYFTTTDSRYEANTSATFKKAPNTISQQSLTFKIPINPTSASTKSATPLGPIGVSLNGVPFFNQYAAMNAALTNEIFGFDQYGGHPQQSGQYHYHVEPLYLTKNKGKDALLGFLLDGFPVYGPLENSKTLTSKDLDAYHGHSHATKEYPNGIYHYHITADDPYLNGSGFYGTVGTISQ